MVDLPLQVHFLLCVTSLWFLLWVVPQTQADNLREHHICLSSQKFVLLQLQQESFNHISWEPGTDCCSWEGVTCNVTTGYVIGLDLSLKLLRPIYSNSSLFGLHHLQILSLANNFFDPPAPIPIGFDRLPSLTHLNLSYSGFSGQIPWEFSHLKRLVSLDLSMLPGYTKLERPNLKALIQNLTSLLELYLDGVDLSTEESNLHWSQVLSQVCPHLRALSLSYCHLSGTIHSSFSQLVFLEKLRLDENDLLIEAPKFLAANFSHLRTLSLISCGLYGELPSSVFNLPNLQILDVSYNSLLNGRLPEFSQNNSFQVISLSGTNFSGVIPDSIGNLRFLMTFQLLDCNFFGLVSPSLTNLTQLYELDLSMNAFTGSFPSPLANLTNLAFLDLSHNGFTGSVPLLNKDNVPNLVNLDLSENLLDGIIHSSLFTLPSLQSLLLSHNQLSGRFELLNNSSSSLSLRYLDLGGNRLSGQIPKSISQFSNLQFLNLSSNNFSGIVNFDMFGNLENLRNLDLSNNQLSLDFGKGSYALGQLQEFLCRSCHINEFPSFLRIQEELQKLDLSNNKISGQLPNWIWKENLEYLNLSFNSLNAFEGPLLNFSSPLYVLDLSNNKLQGSIPIPSPFVMFFSVSNNSFIGEIPESICNLSTLTIFVASYNNLSGSIPKCLGNIGTLSVLDVQGNRFHGMPQHFTSNLRTLKINGNILEGQVPRSLEKCTSLEVLDLGKNKIVDTFPFWLGKLPKLRVLVLHSNKFYGSIKHPGRTFNEFSMLQIMDLSFNRFTGNLPVQYFQSMKAMILKNGHKSEPEYIEYNFNYLFEGSYYRDSVTIMNKGQEMQLVRILTIYTALDLSNNNFQGEIPQVIGDLTSLVVLNLSHNDLIGQIPSSIGNMAALESLDLSQNKLSGQIPWQLANLTFLAFLNFSQNHLEGPIPRGNQLDTFSTTSYNENPGLCGFPLSRKCNDANDDMPPQGEKSTDDFKFDWKFMLMGYGCGIVIGFVTGYIFFKDEWLVRTYRLAPIRRQRMSKREHLGRK